MILLVTYDIGSIDAEGKARARRVRQICKNFGVRVQYSVFECRIGRADVARIRDQLQSAIDDAEDSIRLYYLSDDDATRTEHFGVRQPIDPEGPLVV